jgi:hypothetical protein
VGQSFIYFQQLERIIAESSDLGHIEYAEECLAMWHEMELLDKLPAFQALLPKSFEDRSKPLEAWVYIGCSADGVAAQEWVPGSTGHLPIGFHVQKDVIAVVGKHYDGSGGPATTFEYVFIAERIYLKHVEKMRREIMGLE